MQNQALSPLAINSLTVTAGATLVTWLPVFDMWMRIGASAVAIVSGALVAWVAIRNLRKK